ncbi:MAG: hypothetical protein HPY72_10900 [Anaerolineae bacterium]|jgi:hypothetical protein|nr:hypothetical protein [Anaerolineae bacterium]
MNLLALLKYQARRYLLRKRWLLAIPLGLLTGYWASFIIIKSPFAGASNALEAYIWAFGKPEIVYFLFSLLWIYLVSDVSLGDSYDSFVLLRMGSRSDWWLGKVLFILEASLAYILLICASFALPLLGKYPFSNQWSAAALADFGISLGYSINNGTPLEACLHTLLLLLTGWFAIGLGILVIELLSHRNWPGFLVGVVLIVCSKLGSVSGGPIGGSGIESFFLMQNHLEFTPLWAPMRVIPESYSWLFWFIWIAICLAVSRVINNRRNFYTVHHNEE